MLLPSTAYSPRPPCSSSSSPATPYSTERRKLVFNYSCTHPTAPCLPLSPLSFFLTQLTALPPSGPHPFPALVRISPGTRNPLSSPCRLSRRDSDERRVYGKTKRNFICIPEKPRAHTYISTSIFVHAELSVIKTHSPFFFS